MADEKLPPLRIYKYMGDAYCIRGLTADLNKEGCLEVIRRSDAEPGLRAQNAKLVEALEKANASAANIATKAGVAHLMGEVQEAIGLIRQAMPAAMKPSYGLPLAAAIQKLEAALKGETPQ